MKVFFIATGDIALPAFRALAASEEHHLVALITQPDKPAGRQRELRAPEIKNEAKRLLIPVFQPEKIGSASVIPQMLSYHPDIAVVMAYGQILPREILDLPRHGCLNLHASLLPKYRGASPIQAAIENGDRETGITVMYMDEGLDTGDILLQAKIPIAREETAGTLHDELAKLAPVVMLKALADVERGRAPRIAQDGAVASYAPKIARCDAEIDWTRSAEIIERRIRAYQPWPGAFTRLPVDDRDYRTVKIFFASTVAIPGSVEPGTVLECVPEGIIVATGKGGILIRSLQPEGRRPMTAGEFVRGVAVRIGERCKTED